MAGRRPRLYDTVTKQWIDFNSLQEADNLFMDKEKNPFVTTKDYGVTNRYRYEEPLNNNELLGIALGGKPKKADSTAAKLYKEAKPNVDLEKGLNAVGINPIWDRDYNFKKHPEWRPEHTPLYYPMKDEYWGYSDNGEFTNDIPENVIGSSARRRLQAEAKDALEEKKKWLSEYYNFLEGGFDALSPEALESYNNNYIKTNEKMISLNPDYDPKSPYIMKGRALTALAGKGAMANYAQLLEDMLNLVKASGDTSEETLKYISNMSLLIDYLKSLSSMSNTDLAKLSELNVMVSDIFEKMMNYYMLKYYGNVANLYKDDPTNIGLDIDKHGDYAKLKKFISEDTADKVKNADSGWGKLGWGLVGTLASLGNSVVNNLGALVRNVFSPDEIKNEQRDRADRVINTISDRLVAQSTENYNGDIKKDAELFDSLASDIYRYYKDHELYSDDVYTDEQKRDMLMKYLIQSLVIGQEKAEQNLLKELQNKDFKELGTVKRLLYTGNNLLNTIATTVGHIGNMAWYAPLAAFDVVLAGTDALSGQNFWDSLGDELYDTWNRSLDNGFVNYLSDVEHTGSWLPVDINPLLSGILRSLKYYKDRGISANEILRKYGEENSIFGTTSTLYDIVPVAGYMVGSAAGAKGFNVVSNVMKSVGATADRVSKTAELGKAFSLSNAEAAGYGAISRGTAISSKFLNGTSKFVDATAPAMATAGMDYGYAKSNYDEGMTAAESYIKSPEFAKMVNDRINNERSRTKEGLMSISSSLSDKVAFALNDPNFYRSALQLANLHNNEKSDIEDSWTVEDAAKEMILKPYKDEYLEEAKKLATFNAGLTFGLTILPDVHMTNTWRKAMFSALSRGAMNSLAQNTFFKPIGKILGIKPKPIETYIEGITKKDGKWYVNGKPMSTTTSIKNPFSKSGKKIKIPVSSDLFKIYADQSKAGFLSNYLQDIGVAAGKGLLESMLSLYINQRFGPDATDSISYDMTEAWIASADKAGLAFGEVTSFRDGLYGALAPWIMSPSRGVGEIYKGIKQASNKGKLAFAKSLITEPILKNSLLYNVTFGAKDIVNKENTRRQMLHNTIETWLNANGETYIDNIGSLLKLSAQEKEAIKQGDYTAFNDSRLGQMTTAAIMLSQIQNFLPIKSTIMAYMKDRANRKEVSQLDIDNLELKALQLQALRELLNQEGILEFMQSLNDNERSILSDLVEIRKHNQDTKFTDSRTEVQLLNDLRNNAQRTLGLIDKVKKYSLEAEAKFGDNADLVVKLEYARLKVYLDLLLLDVKEKSKQLKDIESGLLYSDLENAVNSTVPVNDNSVAYISEYAGNKEKLLEGIESNKRTIIEFKDLISQLKSERNKNRALKPKTDEETLLLELAQRMYDGLIKYFEDLIAVLSAKDSHLQKIKKEVEERESEEESSTPLIAAKDMLDLSEEARYRLLTSKKLSKELQAEVDKFKANIEFANDAEETNVSSYIDLLGAKLNSANALRNLSYEGELSPQAIERLNKLVAQARIEQAKNLYAKSFEGFAEESLYHLNVLPNKQNQIVVDDTGAVKVEEVIDESLPEIATEASLQEAYENFVKAYQAKVKEIQEQEEAQELLLGLDKALRDAKNSLYTKMLDNLKQFKTALKDLDQYIDTDVFSKEEIDELLDMIEFATVYKSIQADDVMQTLSTQGESSLLELALFLESKGHTPGEIKDIQGRILQYNHNITETMEKNKKAEEERAKKKEEKAEVKDSKKKAAESKVVDIINKVATFTAAEQGDNMTPMRELLKLLGFGDADSLKSYSNNLLKALRKILMLTDGLTVDEVEKSLDENLNKITQDSETQLQEEEEIELSIILDSLKNKYHRESGSFKSYSKGEPNNGGNGNNGGNNGAGAEGSGNSSGRKLNINNGTPYTFADLSWVENLPEELRKDNKLWNIINDAHVDSFLRNFTVTASTKMVFITAKDWEDSVQKAIDKRAQEKIDKLKLPEKELEEKMEELGYNPKESLPIIGAIKISEFRQGCITIENNGNVEYYQPLGVLPATSKEANTAILRGNVKESPKSRDPYVITLTVMEDGKPVEKELTTTITVHLNGVTIDVDAGPLVIKLASTNVITANNFCVTENGEGAKTNQVPSINKMDTSRANWTTMHVQEMDATQNEDGKTLADLEGEDVINFNSRTKGFAEAILNIVELLKEDPSKFPGNKRALNVSTSDAVSLKSTTSLNSRIQDEKVKVALAPFISLANGYEYYIDSNNGNIDLGIIRKNKLVTHWTLISEDPNSVTPVDLIIKDISALKYTSDEGEEIGVGKWQVNWGNFNLDKKPSPLKTEYIKQAIEDRVLYAFDVKAAFDIQITPVKDLFAEQQLEIKNKEAERRAAQETVDLNINPATGDILGNAGVTLDGMIDFLLDSTLDDIIKDARTTMMNKIKTIKEIAEQKRKKDPELKANQTKSRKKGTKKNAKVLVSNVRGNVVDVSVRDFFNPDLVGQVTKELFVERFKEVFNEATVSNLWEALEQLNATFISNGWKIISTGVYTLDRADNNRIVGELDLLAIDTMGNPHIIDIKTYDSESFKLVDSFHNYNNLVSLYAEDLMDYTENTFPIENLHVYALKVDTDPSYYNVTTDAEGVTTITKKPAYSSKILIAKGARFEHFSVQHVGDAKIAKLREVRAERQLSTSEVATLDPSIDSVVETKTTEKNLTENKAEQKNEVKQENKAELSPERKAELIAKMRAEALQELNQEDLLRKSPDELLNKSCSEL